MQRLVVTIRPLFGAAALAGASILAVAPASAATETFDSPVLTAPTPAPNTWYTDRYAPAAFDGGVAFDGRQVLEVDISSAAGLDDRPPPYNSSFYNTQGRKLDFADDVISMSIELYINPEWQGVDRTLAGFWGTAFNGDGPNPVAYPIIAFNGAAGFQGWDANVGYVSFGLPTGFTFGSWQTLDISLQGTNFIYRVGDKSLSVGAFGSTRLANVMLQGHNTQAGVDYSIRWDNLNSETAIPEPATWALLITGFGLTGAALRRRRTPLLA